MNAHSHERPQRRSTPTAQRGPSGVVNQAEPLSPSYRNRVPKVSCTYRSQRVAHQPELHMTIPMTIPSDS
jgi:hypothetical protein